MISKGMSNNFLEVTIEKKWHTQNFDFLSFKSSYPGQFLGSSNYADIMNFQTFCCNLKTRGLGANCVWLFY